MLASKNPKNPINPMDSYPKCQKSEGNSKKKQPNVLETMPGWPLQLWTNLEDPSDIVSKTLGLLGFLVFPRLFWHFGYETIGFIGFFGFLKEFIDL